MGLMAGCQKPQSAALSTSPATLVTNTPYLNHAQPKLQTIKLWLGAQELTAELALSNVEIYTGMMFRKEMAESEGMLFVFAAPSRRAFYMKNTVLPLSCAYIDSEGAILEIRDLKPLDETPVEAGTDQVQYVLETKQGWFERNKVGVGTLVRTERGSLRETFFRHR